MQSSLEDWASAKEEENTPIMYHWSHADVYKLKIIVIAFVIIIYFNETRQAQAQEEKNRISMSTLLKWYCHKWIESFLLENCSAWNCLYLFSTLLKLQQVALL